MPPVRLAELLGRLSLAFDITNDSPLGKAVRSVVLAVELGAMSGANEEELRDTYWVALLGYLGCTGFAHDEGGMGGGDDRSVRNAMAMFSVDEPLSSTLGVLQRIAPDTSISHRLRLVAGMASDRTLMERFQHAMCDTSIRLAEKALRARDMATRQSKDEAWSWLSSARVRGTARTTAVRSRATTRAVSLYGEKAAMGHLA